MLVEQLVSLQSYLSSADRPSALSCRRTSPSPTAPLIVRIGLRSSALPRPFGSSRLCSTRDALCPLPRRIFFSITRSPERRHRSPPRHPAPGRRPRRPRLLEMFCPSLSFASPRCLPFSFALDFDPHPCTKGARSVRPASNPLRRRRDGQRVGLRYDVGSGSPTIVSSGGDDKQRGGAKDVSRLTQLETHPASRHAASSLFNPVGIGLASARVYDIQCTRLAVHAITRRRRRVVAPRVARRVQPWLASTCPACVIRHQPRGVRQFLSRRR